uniref:hypothetical protein n=1 Tax=Cupriavidus taiwanensis TaxID=164546 RepID=UPI003F497BD9
MTPRCCQAAALFVVSGRAPDEQILLLRHLRAEGLDDALVAELLRALQHVRAASRRHRTVILQGLLDAMQQS